MVRVTVTVRVTVMVRVMVRVMVMVIVTVMVTVNARWRFGDSLSLNICWRFWRLLIA